MSRDPYRLLPELIEDPPRTLWAALRRIGPGMILAASIVGSGELIATTVLGAENGYKLLWLVLLSCVIKIVVQHELGRYAVATGETSLEGFDRMPGPRWRVSWVVWAWFVMVAGTAFTTGAMFTGIAEVLALFMPAVPINIWVVAISLLTFVLLIGGYGVVEKICVGLVAVFTGLTLLSGALLTRRPEYLSADLLLEGVSFSLPEGGLLTAAAVFGITGVSPTELSQYPYWCIEKGYARFTGARDDSAAWKRRAEGWIRVMGLDVLASMLVYTASTAVFYLLGAGVLHGQGLLPQGTDMVQTLSAIYTETLGAWSRPVFLFGAVAVFYSTVFANAAGQARMLADMAGMFGFYDRFAYHLRLRATRWAVFGYLVAPTLLSLAFPQPVMLVRIGGFTLAVLLPVIGAATLYLRYTRLPAAVAPKGWITLGLWLTTAVMALFACYSLLGQL